MQHFHVLTSILIFEYIKFVTGLTLLYHVFTVFQDDLKNIFNKT